MNKHVAKKAMSDDEAAALAGCLLDASHFDRLVDSDCDIVRTDGSPLLMYRVAAFSEEEAREAYLGLRKAAQKTRNRGMASGAVLSKSERVVTIGKGLRYQRILDDGTLSKTVEANEVESGIVGNFDRSARFPYCRQTAFTMAEPDKFAAALPLLRRASDHFGNLLPARFLAQRAEIAATAPDFVIPGTVFTTVTVNRNWQTAVHKDAGDLPSGFGVMCALRNGIYDGGFLCLPQYRVAVDLRHRGLVLADVHEWHGNTPMTGRTVGWERISLVMYYREKMRDCGSAAEELAKAKGRKRGDAIQG